MKVKDYVKTQINRVRKSKQVRYGGYALITSLGLTVVFLIANLLVDQLSIEVDLTDNNLFTLSDQTINLVSEIDDKVTIFQIAPAGRERPVIRSVLERYAKLNPLINIATLDQERNPGLARKFQEDGEQLRTDGLIVQAGERYRIISQYDIYGFNQQTQQVTSVSLERELTSALLFVTTGDLPKIYVLEGHGEQPLSRLGFPGMSLRQLLEEENYEIDSLELISRAGLPEDMDVLLIMDPNEDLTPVEFERIDNWLRNGGRAVFILDSGVWADLPNWEDLLSGYGLEIEPGFIMEASGYHTPDSAFFLVPGMSIHDIVSPFRTERLYTVMPKSGSIKELETKRRTLKIEPFLLTSDDSFLRTNIEVNSIDQQEGESNGPFSIGVSVIDKNSEGIESRIVVFSSVAFLMLPHPNNFDMLLNSLAWAREQPESITIRAKSLITFPLRLTQFAALSISGITVILIPLTVFIIGLIVWLRRRHM